MFIIKVCCLVVIRDHFQSSSFASSDVYIPMDSMSNSTKYICWEVCGVGGVRV